MITRAYTLIEEIFNTLTHAFGALVCAFLFGMLAYHAFSIAGATAAMQLSCCIFGVSSMLVYIASSLYHAISHVPSKRRLKLFDHIAIYFLIVGTYVPLALTVIIPHSPIFGWCFLGIQVACLIFGILYKLFSKSNYGMISTSTYCVLGWSAIFILKPLIMFLPVDALYFLIAGGAMFTIGVPFYILKQYKWTHVIWHVFVLLGTIFHFLMMFSLVG